MKRNKVLLGIILSIILLVFTIPGFTAYYKYTQESGANFYVGVADKADALEDTNEMRQIIDDLGALLVHSKRNDLYPKDATTGGTIQIPEAGLKFSNAPVNDDIAAYIAGEMAWQTKAELGIDPSLYYLKTEIDTLGEVETIYTKDITDSDELASALTDYYLKTAIDTQGEMETIWSVSLANDSELHTILTLGTANGLSLDGQALSLALADTDTTGALSDTDWDTFNEKLSNITGESIGSLSDVDLTDLADGKILKYNTITSKFECESESGGGASQLSDLSDVGVTTPTDKYVLMADGDSWESRAISSDDLSDVATIAMLNESEYITGVWTTFNDFNFYQESDTNPGLGIYWYRSRDGDPTWNVADGDSLGNMDFAGFYNMSTKTAAYIDVIVDGTPDTYIPARIEFSTASDTATYTRRMVIDGSGNIKMGDGAWTNYVNVSAGGAMTAVGTASIKATDLVITSQAAGDILYFDGTNWIRLAIGTAGQILTVNAGGTAPEWQTP